MILFMMDGFLPLLLQHTKRETVPAKRLKAHTQEKQSYVCSQCSEECTDLCIRETEQLLSIGASQEMHGQDSADYLYLKDKGHSLGKHILDRGADGLKEE